MRRLVARRAETVLRARLEHSRVVVVNGPRQAGKTTLARKVAADLGADFVSLDDADLLRACRDDPRGFLSVFRRPLFIDEFQRAGDGLLLAIKLEVDGRHDPGQFVLSGSTRFLTVPTLSESLAGRVALVDLWPYTQGEATELGPRGDALLPALFDESLSPGDLRPQETAPFPSRQDYLQRVVRGGFPEVQLLGEDQRPAWFDGYLRTITQRDAPEISRGRAVAELPSLVTALAALTSCELNVSKLAESVSVEREAVSRTYLPLVQTVYLVTLLPPWSRGLGARVVRRPKVHIADSGLAAHLLGRSADRLVSPTEPATGPLVETFALGELVRQASWHSDLGITLHYFRERGGHEVDVVAEARDGRVVAVEVKAGMSVAGGAARGLAHLRDRIDSAGGSFVRGVVLYTGEHVLPLGDRLIALPLASLWTPLLA